MKIHTFKQQGRRPYQEDYYYADEELGLFIVCDGIGGSARGDLASETVTKAIVQYIEDHPQGEPHWDRLSQYIQQQLLDQLDKHPEAANMGTTAVFAYFGDNTLWIAHVGDSRAYHIRYEDEFWYTKDHSLVRQLYDKGKLQSEEEMEMHPQSNVVTRAFQATPHKSPPQFDVQEISNVQSGDILFICSDGVLEPFSVHSHVEILCDDSRSFEESAEMIQNTCAEQSSDNNTAVMVEVE